MKIHADNWSAFILHSTVDVKNVKIRRYGDTNIWRYEDTKIWRMCRLAAKQIKDHKERWLQTSPPLDRSVLVDSRTLRSKSMSLFSEARQSTSKRIELILLPDQLRPIFRSSTKFNCLNILSLYPADTFSISLLSFRSSHQNWRSSDLCPPSWIL